MNTKHKVNTAAGEEINIKTDNLSDNLSNNLPTGLPNDINYISVIEVGRFLISIDMQSYCESFINHKIDEETLKTLSEDDLMSLGITKMGHRKLILREIKNRFI